MRKIILVIALLVILFFVTGGFQSLGNVTDLFKKIPTVPYENNGKESVRVTDEESVVIDIIEKSSPSVVTVGIEQRILQSDPFDPFGFFEPQQRQQQRQQDIGSGFILSDDGLIVTNKHVVSSRGKYKVIQGDGSQHDVVRIYRDPANDIAILKINATGLIPLELGDSSNLKVGQLVIAMGTPLGEFRGSASRGIISGLGRGIEAGSPFEGFVEQLDNVIQTDAAINPGNSGGPLINSSGQAIGVNTAVASGAENIGFAIPINIIKDALKNFNDTGGFSRPYLGVSYIMVTKRMALANEIPEGAYVEIAVEGGAAEKGGIQTDDVIAEIDGEKVSEDNTLAEIIAKKKVGQQIKLKIWRDEKFIDLTVTLSETPEE